MPRLNDADLVGLISSRICHDLISPVGAITNGIELMEMSGAPAQPEIALIGDSAHSATARIRFFRVAFGAGGGEDLGPGEITGILRDIARSMRQTVEWRTEGPQPRGEVRLCFLALQCCEAAMAHGGTIKIDRHGNGWTVEALAPRLTLDTALWNDLAGASEGREINAARVQFALLPRLIARAGRELAVDLTETSISIRF